MYKKTYWIKQLLHRLSRYVINVYSRDVDLRAIASIQHFTADCLFDGLTHNYFTAY